MKQYTKIIKCILQDDTTTKQIHYILSGNNLNWDLWQIDLTNNFDFNNLEIIKVVEDIKIKSLQDLYIFCNKNNIEIPISNIIQNGLKCSDNDYLIDNDLVGIWLEE